MFDKRKFISAIEKRPSIWDFTDESYSIRDEKVKAWEEVAAEMNPKWETYSSAKRAYFDKELQKKWKNIKDAFTKELKLQRDLKSGASVEKRRKYIFFDMLGFLMPMTEFRRPKTYFEHSNNSDTTAESLQIAEGEDILRPTKRKSSSTTAFEDNLLSSLTVRQAKESKEEDIDGDKAFLLSLLPLVKELTGQQKMAYKVEMLKTLSSMRYPQPSPCASTSMSNPMILILPQYNQQGLQHPPSVSDPHLIKQLSSDHGD